MNDSRNRYYVKNTENGTFQDITTMFNGVAVLKISGFLDKGKPVNIYTEQWIDNQEEDFLITTTENNVPVVIRENTDLELAFIIRQKYATSTINLMTVHDNFINYMTGSDVWLKSAYVGNKYVHCVCLKEYKPTTINLERGDKSYIMGTITMHTLNSPTV